MSPNPIIQALTHELTEKGHHIRPISQDSIQIDHHIFLNNDLGDNIISLGCGQTCLKHPYTRLELTHPQVFEQIEHYIRHQTSEQP